MKINEKVKKVIRETKLYQFIRSIRLRIHYILNSKSNAEDKINELEERLSWFMQHSEITTMKPATGWERKVQLNLTKFAADFFDMIEPLDIHPFMVAGTLIGAIRHKGFIPWDDDLDFGLLRSDYERLKDYAKENWVYVEYDGAWLDYTPEKHFDRISNILNEYPDQYVCDVWVDQIQIFKGKNTIDRLSIDFWPFDIFDDDYEFSEHLKYLEEIKEKKNEINIVSKICRYIQSEINNNKNINEKGCNLYFGIDNIPQYGKDNTSWIKKEYVFPLRKMLFEGYYFNAPCMEKEYIKFEYENYMEFPNDAGKAKHDYWNKSREKKMINVEFYLVDSFEIAHFLPLYNKFLEKGCNVFFIAEPIEKHVSGNYFDYKTAISELNRLEVRYKTVANCEAEISFTTQRASILSKYKKIKVGVGYGAGVYKKGFGYTKDVAEGFDYCLVNGAYMKNVYERNITEDKVFIMGYPKNNSFFKDKPKREQMLHILDIRTEKPIVVYYPTWDENCSISKFANAINELRDSYFIVTKAHHCTFHLEEKKSDLKRIYEISDKVLPQGFDIAASTMLADYAFTDIKSGATTEVPYFNPNVKQILLSVDENYKKDYREELYCLGPITVEPIKIRDTMNVNFDDYVKKREKIMEAFFGKKDVDYLEDIVEKILMNVR